MPSRRKRKNLKKYGWKKRSKMLKQPPKPTMEKTEETHVFVWSQNSQSGGFVSMKLPKGVYISFRSRDSKYNVKVTHPYYPGRLSDDVTEEGRPPDTVLKIPAVKLDEDAMLWWWQRFKIQKQIFLIKNQSCQVIYNALNEGGGPVNEPLYWTPLQLEKYVRKLCRKTKTNSFTDMFSFEWFIDMDIISKGLFFLMLLLLGVLVLLALNRTPPQEHETWTCFNDYEACNRYAKRFLRADNSSIPNMLKENSGPILQFAMGIGVIFICTRLSMDNVIKMIRKRLKSSDSDDESEDDDEDNDDDDGDDDVYDDDDDNEEIDD